MTEYLGAKAYPYQEGWLFRMGTYLINSDYDQYYYLTYEPLVQELPEIEENIPA